MEYRFGRVLHTFRDSHVERDSLSPILFPLEGVSATLSTRSPPRLRLDLTNESLFLTKDSIIHKVTMQMFQLVPTSPHVKKALESPGHIY
jgi:hypothetical protein